MKCTRMFVAAAAALLVALPVGAAVKAMTLTELMEVTDDAVLGRIVAKETFRADWPLEGAVYTRLLVEGTSLRTGRTQTHPVVFLGSHEPDDRFTMSEMPRLRDVRLGNEVIVFSQLSERLGGQAEAHNHGNVYRVEQGFGEPVVMGKGDGLAFPVNTRLSEVRGLITAADAAIRARAVDPLPGSDR